jgi:hypothetical protein
VNLFGRGIAVNQLIDQIAKDVRQQRVSIQWGWVAFVVVAAFALVGFTMGQGKIAEGKGTKKLNQSEPAQSLVAPAQQQNGNVTLAGKGGQKVGSTLLYSSYLGGDGVDYGKGVAIDAEGNIYVLGQTFSDTLFDEEIERNGYSDIFVAKFDPTGSKMLYAKVIGGKDSESPMSIAADGQGNVYVTSYTSDDTFPTKNAQWIEPAEYTNGVLFKLDSQGEMVYSTYLPFDVFYSRHNLVVDAAGNAYVTGSYEAMQDDHGNFLRAQIGLVKFDPNGKALLERNIGGTGTDYGIAIALDKSGNIYLAGSTSEGDGFPVTENAYQSECGDVLYAADDDVNAYCYNDAVVVILTPAGEVLYSSYFGGSFTDDPNSIATDGKGNVMLAGDTASGTFPLVNAIQTTCPIADYSDDCESGHVYVAVMHIDLSGSQKATLTYSTYLGATERNSRNTILAATMDNAGNAYLTGYTSGKKFPLANPVQAELAEGFCYTSSSERYCFDAFITKFSPSGQLLMGSYLGSEFDEYPYGIAVDSKGVIYLAGTTEGSEFPTTDNAYEPSNLINDDGFLVKIGVAAASSAPPPPAPQK